MQKHIEKLGSNEIVRGNGLLEEEELCQRAGENGEGGMGSCLLKAIKSNPKGLTYHKGTHIHFIFLQHTLEEDSRETSNGRKVIFNITIEDLSTKDQIVCVASGFELTFMRQASFKSAGHVSSCLLWLPS